jgi:hypothetical protein
MSGALLIPYIVEGEIIEVNENPSSSGADSVSNIASVFSGSADKKRPIVSYTCRVMMPQGRHALLPDVIEAGHFGGIDDYLQIRRRSATDASKWKMSTNSDNMKAFVGERVYISFINGSINRPVIIGFAQHPNQVPAFNDGIGQSLKPQMKMRYLGLSVVVDPEGQLSITHFGAPQVKYTGTDPLGALMGQAGDAVSALSGSSGYEGYDEGSETLDEPDNDAIVPQSFKFKTTMEFMKSGGFRLRDSIKQNIYIDPEGSKIEITNNGLGSTEPADGGLLGSVSGLFGGPSGEDAEVIRLDKKAQSLYINSRKLLTFYTAGDMEEVAEGDHTCDYQGNQTITVGGDKSEEISGSFTLDVSGDFERTITGSENITIRGDVSSSVMGDVSNEYTGNLDQSIKGSATFSVLGDYDKSITGSITNSCKGSVTDDIVGSWDTTTKGSVSLDTKGSYSITALSDYSLDTKGSLTASAVGEISILTAVGAGMKVSGNTVEVGGNGAGIFESVIAIEEQIEALIDAILQMVVATPAGPSSPGPLIPVPFTLAKTQLGIIKQKLSLVKGSL